ncbi:MAG: type I restriction endonuclease subunit M [Crocinitomicaceae bacterium]|nr:type I restriction endonuclease subunit M [Crocinitomicaceae bacterium]|tara:strand:+ start:411 stop:1853 length:1443 start_codon:yes stop_codon:yes gene_type:complete
MFEQVFKNIDNLLFKDEGCDTEIDYAEQISWMLFLKYLDDLEKSRELESEISGKEYKSIIDEEHRWSSWAEPLKDDGSSDYNKKLTGGDLIEFVNGDLWVYLRGFINSEPKTIQHRIGEIFTELKNEIKSGYTLRECIDLISQLKFQKSEEKHELSDLYEARIKNMGNAGRSGGQYYTPRPLIRALVKVIDPQLGETIYDGACGSAGFLVEAYNHLMLVKEKYSVDEFNTVQTKTLFGKEKSPLAYLIGIMNMILHGIEEPNIRRTNTLAENILDIQEKDRFDIILANPPFGGKERAEVKQNFPIQSAETSYLFMQHFIKSLKAGGRAAVVIKNTVLSNGDAYSIRKLLLESCNLFTVLDLPSKVFGAGVKTVVLFFEKGSPTKETWFYQLDPGRSLGKTNPLNEKDLAEFLDLQKTKPETDKSWNLSIDDLNEDTYDLSIINPNLKEEDPLREPKEILAEMESLDSETNSILKSIKDLL